MWAIKCALLFATLLHGSSHLAVCETLHVCDSSRHFYHSCVTLSQFAKNQINYTRPNTTLIFNGGNHILATGIVASNIMAFSMLSEISSAIIYCHEGANMTFLNVSEVYIHGLTFIGCGGNTAHFVNYLKIEDSQFHGNKNSATSMLISESNANIKLTRFSLNRHGSYRSDIEYFTKFNSSVTVRLNIGGALIVTNSTLTIDYCIFDKNAANVGGAVFIESNSKVFVQNSDFMFNQATGCHRSNLMTCFGGALYIEGESRVNVYNSSFKNNTSDQDGGIAYVFNAILNVSQTIISNNTARHNGGAVNAYQLPKIMFNATLFKSNRAHFDRGALYFSDLQGTTSALINNCNFAQNRAGGDGGAILNRNSNIQIDSSHFAFSSAGSNGGAVSNQNFSEISVLNSNFLHNHAHNGGGVIHVYASCQCRLIQCTVDNNSANNTGGALYAHSSSSIHVQSSAFHNNWAYKGGVLCIATQTIISVNNSSFHGSVKVDTGAVIFAHEGDAVNLYNSTFINNSAQYGGMLAAIKNNHILIDNCTLSNNKAMGSGGTIYARTDCTLVIISSNFIENRADDDGTFFVSNRSSMTAQNSNFTRNIAGHDGGVIFTYHGSVIIFQHCIFKKNRADNTGGIICGRSDSNIALNNCNINSNSAQTLGGGIYAMENCHIIIEASKFFNNKAKYGGVLAAIKSSNVSIDTSTLSGNMALGDGAAVYALADCVLVITGSIFRKNRATDDGTVLVADSSCMIAENSAFIANVVGYNGGAIHMYDDSSINIQHCIFTKNRAENAGGVINGRRNSNITVNNSIIKNNSAQTIGGGIHAMKNCHIIIETSTFIDNSANHGGVLIAVKNSYVLIDKCTLSNNIARGNGGAVYSHINCTIVIIDSIICKNRAIDDGIVLAADSCNMMVEHSIFVRNVVGHDGGVIHVYDDSNITVDCCQFNGNRANNSGGAIYGRSNGRIILKFSSMSNNSAQTSGGGIYAQKDCSAVIEASNFAYNTAGYGGAVHAYVSTTIEIFVSNFVENWANVAGGALATYESSDITAEKCNFTSNFAGAGGVSILFQNTYKCSYQICDHDQFKISMITFNKSRFLYNKADKNGVLYAQGSILKVVDCFFYGNNAAIRGGVIYATSTSIVNIHKTNFVNNTADRGGVLALSTSSSVSIEQSNFTKCRAYDNGGVLYIQWSNASIRASRFNSAISDKNGGVFALLHGFVKIEGSSFINNSGIHSGGVFYASSNSNLIIICSIFISNGASYSGGVLHQEETSTCTVVKCSFLLNRAMQSGGVLLSLFSFISIINSSFNTNFASKGAALSVVKNSFALFEATQENYIVCDTLAYGFDASMFDVSTLNPFSGTETNFSLNQANETGGAIYMEESSIKLEHTVYINRNQATSGGGIYAVESSITFESFVDFYANQAEENGGGISLTNSVFSSINKAATIKFESNRAMYGNGGAIYVDDKSVCECNPTSGEQPNKIGCFFQNATKNFTIAFIDNHACRGHDLFGGLLDRCTVFSDARSFKLEPSGTTWFKEISNLTSDDTVSSKPVRLCLCEKNISNCSQQTHELNVVMKNKFSINIAAVDHVNHMIPATIVSKFKDLNLTESETLQTIGSECRKIKYNVDFPTVNIYKFYMYPDGPCADKGVSKLSISVNVISCTCPPGFMQNNVDTKCACICDKFFSRYIKQCNSKTKTVVRKGSFWITYLINNRFIDSAKNMSPYFIYPYCPLNYCHSPSTPVHINFSQPNGSDAQCVDNRGGFLCGGCLPQYSLSFGSSRCIKCPKHWYGFLVAIIFGSLLAGLMLVFLILVLNLTVAVGTLNSLFFYANIIDANKSIYFGQESQVKFFPMFISWLNLNIGFDVCFFKGMDSYSKVWLELGFPVYIILLVILIICVSSRSSKLSMILGKRNPVATLATLILVSYTKLLEAIVVSFSFVCLKFRNGTVVTKWLPDASVNFTPWKHGALILMGILVLIFGLLYTALVLFWQLLLRCPRNYLLKFTRNQKLHSFVEAYHIPYNAKHRYWTGLLLLVRIIVYLTSTLTASIDPRITLLATVAVMSCLLLYKTLLVVNTYKNRLLSAIESFTLINIAIFAMFTWYAFDNTGDQSKENLQKSVAYISVGIVFILFSLILIFHIYRYGNSKVYSIVRNLKVMKKLSEKIIQQGSWTTSCESNVYNYNLFDLIDNRETDDQYTPPPVHLQQGISKSVVSVTDFDTSECQLEESQSDFDEKRM